MGDKFFCGITATNDIYQFEITRINYYMQIAMEKVIREESGTEWEFVLLTNNYGSLG